MVYIYKKKFPSVDDLVIAKIDDINEYGVYVSLPEYNDAKGYIAYKEVSRKKKKDINKIVSIGKELLLIVIATNEEKQFMDLSRRTISEDEIALFKNKSRVHMQIYNFFRYIFMKLKKYESIECVGQDELYEFMKNTFWEIQEEYENDVILELVFDKDRNQSVLELINYEDIGYSQEEIKLLVDNYIDTKLNVSKQSMVKQINMLSYNLTGLEDIKYALDYESFSLRDENIKNNWLIEIKYLTDSKYSITINQKEQCEQDINLIYDKIYSEIKKRASEKNILFQ